MPSIIQAIIPKAIKSRLLLPYLGDKRNPGNPIQLGTARNAINDILVAEDPPGSNRNPRIDEFNNNFYSPLGSSWCANAVGTWVRDAGGKIPENNVGDSDEWYKLAIKEGLFSLYPKIGSVCLYGIKIGNKVDIQHVGVVCMLYPYLLSVEGNTTLAGYARNGDIVAAKPVNLFRLIGYAEVWR